MSCQITSSWLWTVSISDNKYEDTFSQQPWNHSLIPDKVKEQFNSIQFIFHSSDPEGGCNPQVKEHTKYI